MRPAPKLRFEVKSPISFLAGTVKQFSRHHPQFDYRRTHTNNVC